MKANDPKNLRKSAVRLVAELMPQGAVVGIWTFGGKVDQIVAPSSVNKQWKSAAKNATRRIHSRGQFTNIEAALDVAIRDWGGASSDALARHVILLTDGMVDVSKQPEASAASRQRILDRTLKRLRAVEAKVHTISLSENSDQALMSALASQTGGWAEQINDAAALQRVFLHMFEQAAQPDSVPLLDNRFDVDGSIRELTLLVFRESTDQPLQLISPAGDQLQQAFHPENVKWLVEEGYDLVTISQPEQGTWQINTEPDPDNRVLIVTDLKLETNTLPASLLQGESVQLNAYITEQGQRLQREDFLNLLRAELLVSASEQDEVVPLPLELNLREKQFTHQLTIDQKPGEYEFLVRVDGGTFKRVHRQKLRIHDTPVTLSHELAADATSAQVMVHADSSLVDLPSLSGLLIVSRPDGTNEVLNLPQFLTETVSLSVEMPVNGTYQIAPVILGDSMSGRNLNIKLAPVSIDMTAGRDAPATKNGAIDWLQVGLVVLAGNIVMGFLLWAIWFWLGRRSAFVMKEVVVK